MLYVAENAGSDGQVVAFDAKTGAQEWTTTLPRTVDSLALAGSRLFVNDGLAGVYALSTGNGKQLWNYSANANYTNGGVLSVADGIVFTDGGGGNNGNDGLTALNEKNGALLWASSFGNGAAPATPVIVNGAIYAGCYTLCALKLPALRARY
jgi:outer membrane protein assembly factor BamB